MILRGPFQPAPFWHAAEGPEGLGRSGWVSGAHRGQQQLQEKNHPGNVTGLSEQTRQTGEGDTPAQEN